MKFDIITIFPSIFDSYFNESILKRAREKKLVDIRVHNLRDFANDKRKTVDHKPYGGGAGMVLMAEPILRAVDKILSQKGRAKRVEPGRTKVIILSAKGKPFNQKFAHDWAKKYNQIILVSGRYEGIDERVKTALKAEEISIGPYVLTDGELPAMVIVSAVTRLLPGAIRLESLGEESHCLPAGDLPKGENLKKTEASVKGLEYPHYTRPEILKWKGKNYRVPKLLLSGNHRKISEWRKKHEK